MKEIKTIAVIGAGIMGRGIAHVAALGGYRTVLQDISNEVLAAAMTAVETNLRKAVDRNLLAQPDAERALSRLTTEADFAQAVAGADLAIEAVPERIELKTEVFVKLDEFCVEQTIFATNTSSLSVTEIAAVVSRPQNVVGMHFFNPVHKMKLVEIVRVLESSETTIQCTREVAQKMGKETVTIKESPGFITSRINAMIGNEAFYMLQEGIATAEEIDKALKLGLNHPMGPFEMVDLVGLDTRLSILRFLHKTLGEKYRPCPLMEQYVKAGRLGRKTGKGVFDYKKE